MVFTLIFIRRCQQVMSQIGWESSQCHLKQKIDWDQKDVGLKK